MTIEARLESLENAVVSLTEALKSMTSGTAITAATTSTKNEKSDKDEGKGETSTRRRSSTSTKAPTEAALKKEATAFLDAVEGDEDGYKDRREEIARLAEKYDVKRLSEAAEEDRAAIIDALKKFAEEHPVGGKKDDDSGI